MRIVVWAVMLTAAGSGVAWGDASISNLGVTNTLAALSTNTTSGATGCGSAIDMRGHDRLALQVEYAGAGASPSNIVLNLVRAAYTTNYESTASISVELAVQSTDVTNVVWVDLTTNVGPAAAWVKIGSVWNQATNAVSNVVVRAVRKKVR